MWFFMALLAMLHFISSPNGGEMNKHLEEFMATVKGDVKDRVALHCQVYEIEQAATYILENEHYLIPDELEDLVRLKNMAACISNRLLERIENEKEVL